MESRLVQVPSQLLDEVDLGPVGDAMVDEDDVAGVLRLGVDTGPVLNLLTILRYHLQQLIFHLWGLVHGISIDHLASAGRQVQSWIVCSLS